MAFSFIFEQDKIVNNAANLLLSKGHLDNCVKRSLTCAAFGLYRSATGRTGYDFVRLFKLIRHICLEKIPQHAKSIVRHSIVKKIMPTRHSF